MDSETRDELEILKLEALRSLADSVREIARNVYLLQREISMYRADERELAPRRADDQVLKKLIEQV